MHHGVFTTREGVSDGDPQHRDHYPVAWLTVDCSDRLYLNGYVPTLQTSAVGWFLKETGNPIPRGPVCFGPRTIGSSATDPSRCRKSRSCTRAWARRTMSRRVPCRFAQVMCVVPRSHQERASAFRPAS